MDTVLRLNEKYWPILALALLAVVTVGSLSPRMPVPGVMESDKTRHFLGYAAVALPSRWRGRAAGG